MADSFDCDCGDCLGNCCDGDCFNGCCDDTDCCCCCFYSSNTHRSRSTGGCSGRCCRVVAALIGIAVAAVLVYLVVSYAVAASPERVVTVEDAHLRRFALTNGTALAYDVWLDVAVRRRDMASAELRFHGQTLAQLEMSGAGTTTSSLGKGGGVYRVTMASAAPSPAAEGGGVVVLGGDAVAEFVRESVAGVFELELELAVVAGQGEGHHHGVSVTCPLKLSLPTAAATTVKKFTRVKCT